MEGERDNKKTWSRLRYTFSRDRNLSGGLLVGVWNRWAGNDDREDAVLHIRDHLVDLSCLLDDNTG